MPNVCVISTKFSFMQASVPYDVVNVSKILTENKLNIRHSCHCIWRFYSSRAPFI